MLLVPTMQAGLDVPSCAARPDLHRVKVHRLSIDCGQRPDLGRFTAPPGGPALAVVVDAGACGCLWDKLGRVWQEGV